jgi:predicted phosphate transport protein (TIGR00153 family)
MEKRTLNWFERRHKTKGLDLAHQQIVKAVETIVLLQQAVKNYSEGNTAELKKDIATLYATEEEVDRLRSEVFRELSKGSALISDYREDLLHLVKRLDTAADSSKDAARCIEMLADAQLPLELLKQTAEITDLLVKAAQTLRRSIDSISNDPAKAISEAHKVQDIEHEVDQVYLATKALFVKYGNQVNPGAMVIFDDMIEFLEQTSDLCADTADYIVILSSTE